MDSLAGRMVLLLRLAVQASREFLQSLWVLAVDIGRWSLLLSPGGRGLCLASSGYGFLSFILSDIRKKKISGTGGHEEISSVHAVVLYNNS